MDLSILILVIAVAAVASFVWNQRQGSSGPAATSAPPAPAPAPVATPAKPAPAEAGAGPLASYDEYRRANPSHMVYNKLTCNRCGSNRIAVAGGTAVCGNCGAALYRA
jgi:hypothetical protein